MKKLLLSLVAIVTLFLNTFGQSPEGFKYQAVVRDAGNVILNNQAVGMRLTIQQGAIGGTAVYTETFAPTTNAYGLVNLEIGSGTTSDDFSTIDWANGPYFMETAIDVSGGTSYTVMGTSQLLSVPYALYAKTAGSALTDNVDDADADPTNELQAVSFSNDTLYLSNGGQVYLGGYGVDLVDDADADPTNELQIVSFSNDTLYLSDGGQVYLGTYGVDLVDDADADPVNEIQDLQLVGNILTITNNGTATSIDLSGYLDNTDTQLNEAQVDTYVANNGYLTTEVDGSTTNELQTISRTGTTVTLSNSGGTFEDSVGVYTAGAGIDITGNVISASGNDNAWLRNGNAGTIAGTNFLGTLDAQDLVFKTNNVENMRINTSGNVDIGATLDDARVYARILDTDLITNYGLYVYHDGGTTTGVTYGIRNLNYSATNSTKYGLYNYTNGEGTGGRYGIYNSTYLDVASTGTAYGIRNYVSTSGSATGGTQYGLYNYVTSSAATGLHYAQQNYLYLNPASVADNFGEYTYVDFTAGARYGEYKDMATNTAAAGTVYGDYNYIGGTGIDNIFGVVADIPNAGTGTHYGIYSNVPGGTNDYAAMFIAGHVVMNENAGDYDLRVEGTTITNLLNVDASQNKVGIGVATPTYMLDILDPSVADPTYVYRGRNSAANGTRTQIGSIEYFQDQASTIDFTGGSNFSINLNAAAAYDLQLAVNSAAKPGSNAWTVVSDSRLKEDINPFKDGLSVLRNIEPVYFKYNGKANIKEEHYFVGVIAQDLEEIAPYMVGSFETADGNLPFNEQEANTETYKTVDNGAMTYIAINAIKELDAQHSKIKETFKNISDFGVTQLTAVETFVPFNEDFKNKLNGIPVVTVTSINSLVGLTLINQTREGFTVKVNGEFQAIDFNWIAMAKVKEDALEETLQYDEVERLTMLEKVKAENAKINYEAEYAEAELRKLEDAQNQIKESNNPVTIIPVPGKSPEEEPVEPEIEEKNEK